MQFLFVLLSSYCPATAFVQSDRDRISVHSYETEDCHISFLEYFGKKYVVKQIKDPSPDEQFLLVLDTLGCHIAFSAHIPQNYVVLIPPGKFPGKKKEGFPATLHTLAPGVSTDQECPFQGVDIHQRYRKENSRMWSLWGPLAPENTGLTYTVIKNMARHPDLPKIAALDTFVGNADRSSSNLFYDVMTHHFCGIDMAASFSTPLAQEALRQLRELENRGIQLTLEERTALDAYANTLNHLLETWPVERLEMKLKEFANNAGFIEGSWLYDQNVAERIEFHLNCMKRNYQDCKELSAFFG